MRNIITIDGLDLTLSSVITNISITNGRSVERTDTGIKWNGRVSLGGDNNIPISNSNIQRAIRDNSSLSFEELNVKSQIEYSKDYIDLSVAESQSVQGIVMANNMITAINATNCGLVVDDITLLVSKIVEAIA